MQLNRRHFNQALTLGAATTVGHWPVWAAEADPKSYVRLPKPIPTAVPAGKVEVLEFFAYSCIHCFHLEPALHDWVRKQPAQVVVQRVPVQFSPAFEPMAKLYYSLEALNLLDPLHTRFFAALHVEKQRLYEEPAIMAWLAQQKIDMVAFKKMYSSFGVAGKTKRAVQLTNSFLIEGTPALGINGQFMVPGQGDKTLAIADTLIAPLLKT
jgi:protein dithiol oxidoreductase (disulfide-forming)